MFIQDSVCSVDGVAGLIGRRMSAVSLTLLLKDVAPDALQQLCTDRHLRKLAKSIPDWKDLAPFLDLSEVEEKMIEEEHKTPLRRRIAILRLWRQKKRKKATYKRLAKVFWEMGNASVVDEIAKILSQESDSSEGEPDASQKTRAMFQSKEIKLYYQLKLCNVSQ